MKKLSAFPLFLAALALWMPFTVSLNAVSLTIVISEFRVRGPNGGSDEFVEIHNRSGAPVDVGGWKLRGSNVSGTIGTRATIPAGVVINPGCYYLFTNSSTSGGPYSGAIAGNQTYATGITDDGGLAITMPDDSVVDQVGMSTGSAFKEGTPVVALGSSNQDRGYHRLPGGTAGHDDSDNNSTDFALIAPSTPQNNSSACLGDVELSIEGAASPNPVVQLDPLVITAAVTPASDSPVDAQFAVNADLSLLGGLFDQPLVDDGTNGDAVAGDLVFTYEMPGVIAGPGAYEVIVNVRDDRFQMAFDSFVVTVLPVPSILLPHEVQGAGATSPRLGETVTVQGVVTARRLNGVFIQTEPDQEDTSDATSEGLFVFTGSAPPAAATVGTLVRVTGLVAEFGDGGPLMTQTELTGSPTFVTMGAAGSMPAPASLTLDDLAPGGTLAALEPFENMQVSIASLTTVSGTEGFLSEVSGVVSSNGIFYATLTGTPRPTREPGIDSPLASTFATRCAAGPPCAIPVFDTNSERLRIDSDGLGAPRLDVTSGVVIQNLTAIVAFVDLESLAWNLFPLPGLSPTISVNVNAGPVTAPASTQFTVASLNLHQFFDATNDPDIGELVISAANYADRLQKASLVVRTSLQMPDILAVQEMESLPVLQELANRINTDAGLAGEYSAYLEEGNDPGGIDVGFLVRRRVHVNSVVQEGLGATFIDPDDGSVDSLNDRPPLVLRATVDGPATMLDAHVIVVANHLRSLLGIESPTSDRVRVKRQKQAEFLASLLNGLQSEGAVIAVGDFNAFEVNDGFVDVMGTVRGDPTAADQVVVASPDLVDPNFVEAAPGRYSYVFEGNVQTLDHVLLSTQALEQFDGLEHARINADAPHIYRAIPTRPDRISDHDAAVAYFAFPLDTTPPTIHSVTPSVASLWPVNHKLIPVTVRIEVSDNLAVASCSVTGVTSSDPDDATGDGSTSPDWIIDGPFALRLRAERRGSALDRIYLISVTCEDTAGNQSTGTTQVVVPHDGQ